MSIQRNLCLFAVLVLILSGMFVATRSDMMPTSVSALLDRLPATAAVAVDGPLPPASPTIGSGEETSPSPLTATAMTSAQPTTTAAAATSAAPIRTECYRMQPHRHGFHAHPLESETVQGSTNPHVQTLAEVMKPFVSHGYYHGFVSLGAGDVFAVKSRAQFDRHQDPRAHLAPGAMHSAQKAVASLPNGSMAIMWMGDTSPFCYADARDIIAGLNKAHGFGRLWWLTYNPCILDAQGRIGEYEVPIPSFDLHFLNQLGRETRHIPMAQRSRMVLWRGQTTGVGDDGDYRYDRWGNYRTCQRYKVVDSFNKFVKARPDAPFDVKFVGDDINSQGMVPREYWGGRASESVSAQIQLDVDGNGISWLGVRRKLGSGSVTMRAFSNMTQFYFPWLKNGTHILVYNTTDQLAQAAYSLLQTPQSETTLSWMSGITKNAAKIVDQLDAGRMDSYLADRVLCAAHEYNADKDWRIQL